MARNKAHSLIEAAEEVGRLHTMLGQATKDFHGNAKVAYRFANDLRKHTSKAPKDTYSWSALNKFEFLLSELRDYTRWMETCLQEMKMLTRIHDGENQS